MSSTELKEFIKFIIVKTKVERGETVNIELSKLPSFDRSIRLGKYYEVILKIKMPFPKRVFNILLLRFFENPSDVLQTLRNTPFDPVYSDESFFDKSLKGLRSADNHHLIVRRRGKYFDYVANQTPTIVRHLQSNSIKDAMQGVCSILGKGSEGLVYELHKDLISAKEKKYRFANSQHLILPSDSKALLSKIIDSEPTEQSFIQLYDMLMKKLESNSVWKEIKLDMNIYLFEEIFRIYARWIEGK